MKAQLVFDIDLYTDALADYNARLPDERGPLLDEDHEQWGPQEWETAIREEIVIIVAVGKELD